MPSISIITVTLNSESTILDTILSVKCQDFQNFEHIIVDGLSIDRTLQIVKDNFYPNMVVISEKDCGLYDAINKGLRIASGEIIGILNSDDFYLTDHVLQEVVSLFEADNKLEVVLGGVDLVSGDDLNQPKRRYSAGNFKAWMFRFGLMPPHPAVFIRKAAYQQIGGYKLGYKIAADFDLLVRLLHIYQAKYQISDKTWVRMRIGGISTSGLNSFMTITHEMRRSLVENKLYSNQLMLLCRLPIKYLTQVLCR